MAEDAPMEGWVEDSSARLERFRQYGVISAAPRGFDSLQEAMMKGPRSPDAGPPEAK
jgi:hypothetical protein